MQLLEEAHVVTVAIPDETRRRLRANPRGRVAREPGHVIAPLVDLADVGAGADLEVVARLRGPPGRPGVTCYHSRVVS